MQPGWRGGRSAFRGDIKPLLKLAKLRDVDVFRTEFYIGPMVNLDRPKLSPCLSRVAAGSPAYDELLEAIRAVQKRLQAHPRGDVLDGFVPYAKDAERLAHRQKYAEYERQVRAALRNGQELYDSDFADAK